MANSAISSVNSLGPNAATGASAAAAGSDGYFAANGLLAGQQDYKPYGDLLFSGQDKLAAVALVLGASGPVASAAASVDAFSQLNVTASAASLLLTLPSPTVTTKNIRVIVTNTGTVNTFSMNGVSVALNAGLLFVWNASQAVPSWELIGSSSLNPVRINASAGASLTTLAAATGSGNSILYTLVDKTNTATLAVPVGGTLNGVLNGTFLFSAYTIGTQFLVTDRATGLWDVTVIGASTTTTLHYASLNGTVTAAVTSASGTLNVFSFASLTIRSNVGSMINQAGHQIAIQQAGTYRLFATAFDGTDAMNLQINKNGVAVTNSAQFSAGDLKYPGVNDVILPLVAGDIITVQDAFGTLTNIRGVSITVQQLPDATQVLAGMVVPTALNWVSMSNITSGNGAEVTTKAGFVELSAASVIKRDPSGMVVTNATGDYVQILQNGNYNVEMSIGASASVNVDLQLNGVIVATTVCSTANFIGSLNYTANLVAGDRLRVACTATAGRFSLSVNQRPISAVVDPGTVPVAALSKASINVVGPGVGNGALMSLTSTTGLANAPFTIMPTTARLNLTSAGWTTPTSQILVDTITVGATGLTIVNTGLYRINASATIAGVNASGIQIVQNGTVIAFGSMYAQPTSGRGDPTATCVVNLTAGDVIDFRVANQNTAALTVELFSIDVVQLPTSTVIIPGSVAAMTGATSVAAGTSGWIGTAPIAGQQDYTLRGDATWDFQGKKSVVQIANIVANGSIGTAVTTVDIADELVVNQTTANITLTLQNPTVTTKYRTLTVQNIGTADFVLSASGFAASTVVPVNGVLVAEWNGKTAGSGAWVLLAVTPKTPVVQTFIASGTYTPTFGMKTCIVEAVAGGGGGSGCTAGTVSGMSFGRGGGAGGEIKALYTAAQIGASQAVAIGAAGTAGAVAAAGGNGGNTTLGALFNCAGGTGGSFFGTQAGPGAGGTGGTGGSATVSSGVQIKAKRGEHSPGGFGIVSAGVIAVNSSGGAGSSYGGGGLGSSIFVATASAGGSAGAAASGFGAGGGAGASGGTGAAQQTGGAGAAGWMQITEYF